MKTRIIYSNYSKETKESIVQLRTDRGIFSAKVVLHEDDLDIESNFAGCRYAEIKALIKYMKFRILEINIQLKGLKNYEKTLKNLSEYNKNSLENRKLRKYIYKLEAQKTDWNNKIKSLTEKMLYEMEHKRDMINKIKKKGDENKK